MSFSTEEEDLAFALQLQAEFNYEEARNAAKETSAEPKATNEKPPRTEDVDRDFEFAKKLQEELSREAGVVSPSRTTSTTNILPESPQNIVNDNWELIDPIPDVHALFLTYNEAYFWGRLNGVEVKWSSRMTVCAGLCCYEGKGGLCSIRLSEPLLKLRPRKDLVQTLLHEMIHAFLFVIGNNRDHDAHGPEFHKHMQRINEKAGTKITVYHSFHDEVNSYKTHWWRCDGPCRERHPYYGYVKRSMNRKPQPADTWWSQHQASCGGTFLKIKEPESNEKKRKNDKETGNTGKKSKLTDARKSSEASNSKDIRSFFASTKTDETSTNKKVNSLPSVSGLTKPSSSGLGGFTKVNGGGTLTVTMNNKKKSIDEKNVSETTVNASNVFTINSFGSNSGDEKKASMNPFQGQGRTLGSS